MFNFAPVIPARSDLDWCWYLRRHGKIGDVYERVLHDIGVMDPAGWAPWGGSQLTQTGAPVEVTFTENDAAFALTTEVADPSVDPTDRLKSVCRLIQDLGEGTIDRSLLDVIGAAQSGADMQYGARLGLAARTSGLSCTLIAELPDSGADVAQLLYKNSALAGNAEGRPAMLAVDATSGMITLYFKDMHNDVADLGKKAGLPVERLTPTGFETQHALVIASIDRAGDIVALGRQFRAADLFQNDLKAARYLRDRDGFCDTAYRTLADHLPPAAAGAMAHNTISLTASRGEKARMQVSVAAPWGCMVDDM